VPATAFTRPLFSGSVQFTNPFPAKASEEKETFHKSGEAVLITSIPEFDPSKVTVRLVGEFLISGICASAHSTAATWAVNQLSHSAFFLSLISTFTSLPFFLFTLPAGALADIMDRGKLVAITHIWLAAAAAALAVLGWFNLLNGSLILLFTFLISAGLAFNAPAFCSLLTDIVSSDELPSATVLNGLQLDLSGMIGSALGGAVIHLIGTNTIFAVNGAAFLLMNLALLQRRGPKEHSQSAMENFFQSFATAVHYVRYAPGMQVILARQILFSLLVAAIPALLPVVALNELHIGAAELGLLYTSMSAGSVITAAFILPWGRERYLPDTLTKLAAYLFVLVMGLLALVRQAQPALAADRGSNRRRLDLHG
jgi:MFS family permease